MSSIDKRIVQMQFDNQNFESGVKTTMSTLQRLNEKLKMKSSTGGLDEVSKSVSNFFVFYVLSFNVLFTIPYYQEFAIKKFSIEDFSAFKRPWIILSLPPPDALSFSFN